MDTETGFSAMSRNADAGDPVKDAMPASSRLEDSEITEAGRDRANQLQRLIVEEIRDRPVRALGWAAAAGFVLGIWVSR